MFGFEKKKTHILRSLLWSEVHLSVIHLLVYGVSYLSHLEII